MREHVKLMIHKDGGLSWMYVPKDVVIEVEDYSTGMRTKVEWDGETTEGTLEMGRTFENAGLEEIKDESNS